MQALTGVPSCSSGRVSWQQQQQQQQQQRSCAQLWSPGHAGRCRRLVIVAAAGSNPSNQQQQKQASKQPSSSPSSRNARLYELFDDDGWGVEAVAPATQQPAAVAAPSAPKQQEQVQKTEQPPGSRPGKRRKRSTPLANLASQEGKLGLTLLQRVLEVEEEEQQQQRGTDAAGPSSKPTLDEVRAKLAAAGSSSKRQKPKLPGFPKASAAAAATAGGRLFGAGAAGSDLLYDDEDEDEDEDESTPAFQITFDEQGRAEMESFATDEAADTSAAAAADVDDDDADLDDFGMSGWGQFGADDEDDGDEPAPLQQQQQQRSIQATRSQKRAAGASEAAALEAAEAEADLALLRDMSNEDDWGLEALTTPGLSTLGRQLQGGRRSLIDELTAAEEAGEDMASGSSSYGGHVQWGGSAGTTGIDMEEQEALLARYFRPNQVKKLMQEQQEVDASYSVLRKRAVGMGVSDHKLQEKLRIVSGSAAGRKLVSFRSPQTRPMMEKVRQAIFNMLQSRAGTLNSLPRSARWLDLFAGTGSVGLEALSRGCKEAHFVEMDPVVVSKILERNIKYCGFKGRAWAHTSKAEDFLRRSAAMPRFAGGPFDFISVCPPYLLVSYPELFELLDVSPLVHPGTILFVEYPKQLAHQVVDRIGPLQRVRDRRYGRTWVALYAAADGADEDEGGAGEDDPFLSMQL